ncbi:MAG: hypothetical protein HQ512_15065 [Rhodospirillales bacterium]|nr:hypothetical protein [Rhodospirillales bacterium]
MKTKIKILFSTALALSALTLSMAFTAETLAAGTTGASRASQAQCTAFPKIPLWKSLSHDFVREKVATKYEGDWQAYIQSLQGYQNKLKAIHARGSSAAVSYQKRSIRLQGKSLATFLKHVDKRIAVTQCLSNADDAAGLADFSTAAGGSEETISATFKPKQCDTIPNIEWWKFKTHANIIGYVARKYSGDWSPYIDKWSVRLDKLTDIYNRGSSAVTNTGLTLQGRDLYGYMGEMEKRISVIRCLARNSGSSRT